VLFIFADFHPRTSHPLLRTPTGQGHRGPPYRAPVHTGEGNPSPPVLGARRDIGSSPSDHSECMPADIQGGRELPDWVHVDVPFIESPLPTSDDNLPPIGKEGNSPVKVICKVLSLDWGGECVQNPCQTATGYVMEVVPDGKDGKVCYKVNFGEDLGVQVVPVEDCGDWAPPQVSAEEYHILDMMVEYIRPHPFSADDIHGRQSLRYGDVFKNKDGVRRKGSGRTGSDQRQRVYQDGSTPPLHANPDVHISASDVILRSLVERLPEASAVLDTGLSDTGPLPRMKRQGI
jgi:hypothetical protein